MGSVQPLAWQQQELDVATVFAAEAAAFEDSLSQWWTDLVARPLETLALVWGAEFDGASPSRATKLPTGGPARPGASKLHSSSNSSGGSTTSSSGSENESMPAAAATGHAGLVRHRSKPPSGALQAFAAKSNGNGSSSASGIGSSGTGSFIDSNMCRGSTTVTAAGVAGVGLGVRVCFGHHLRPPRLLW